MKYLMSVLGIVTSLSMFTTVVYATDGDVDIKNRVIFEGSTLNGANLDDDDRYGTSVANIGDIDGDGVDDFAIGAVLGDDKNGEIHIHFMKKDGSIKKTVEINSKTDNSGLTHGEYNRYGSAITGLGDIDGDGVNDIAVGAEGEFFTEEKTRGAVYMHFMNNDGSIKDTKKIISPESNGYNKDMFGSALASADYNGDGDMDLAVGAKGNDEGYIYIFFLDNDGDFQKYKKISSSTKNGASGLSKDAMYGSSIANIGDIDNDGVNDIIVGAPNAIGDKKDAECVKGKYCQQGAVYVHLMNDDATIKKTISFYAKDLKIEEPELRDRYGVSVAGGDFNKDGVIDIAVGASGRWSDEGVVYFHILNEDIEVVETEAIDDNTPNGGRDNDGDDFYGAAIANVGDFNNDDIEDLLVGSYGFEGGMAYLHFLDKSSVESQNNTKRGANGSGDICDVSEIEYSPIYRLYNTDTGFHLYTRGEADRNKILNRWNAFEFTDWGPAFYASLEKTCEDTTPIYRLYNNKTGAHLYTRGEADRDKILNKYPDFEFTDAGPAFYASLTDDGTTPIYRLYNTKTGVHLYARGKEDRDKVMNKWTEFEFTDGYPAFYARLDI